MKLHALFDLVTGDIREVEATQGTRYESPMLASFLSEIDDLEVFVTDPGYLSRRNLRLVSEKDRISDIRPKGNSVFQPRRCWPWRIWWPSSKSIRTSSTGSIGCARGWRRGGAP